jgi:lactoylglutathione lyase
MAKAIHSMIRVLDLERSIDFYARVAGFRVSGRIEYDDVTLVYLRNDESEFELELMLNHARSEPYRHGFAYGHFVGCVRRSDGAVLLHH